MTMFQRRLAQGSGYKNLVWGTATQRMKADSLDEQTWTDWRSSTRVEELSNELRSGYRYGLKQVKDCGGV